MTLQHLDVKSGSLELHRKSIPSVDKKNRTPLLVVEVPSGTVDDDGAESKDASLPAASASAEASYQQQRQQQRRCTDARAIQCYLLCGTRLFQQAMRNTLTNVLVFMSTDMDISVSEKGSLLAAIATGYFFTQVPGGAMADCWGAKRVMTCSIFLSAICSMAVPFAYEYMGLRGIWFAMCAMGAVQGPLFPTSSVYLSKWMPTSTGKGQPDEKAWGSSMLDIGISIGSLLVIPLVTSLAENFGWRNAFVYVGATSLAFVAVFVGLGADEPSQCWFISDRELEYLNDHVVKRTGGRVSKKHDDETADAGVVVLSKKNDDGLKVSKLSASTSWIGLPWRMAKHHGLWAIYLCHMAFNFGAYYLTNWSPQYYKEVLRLEPKQAQVHLMCPHIANLVIRFTNPALVQAVSQKGVSLLKSRKLFTVVGFFAAALCLSPVYSLRTAPPWVSTTLLSLANAFFGLAPTGFKSNYLDVTQDFVGIVSGYGNTLGTVASIMGPRVTAAILVWTNGNWHLVLWTVCAVNIVAASNYLHHAVVSPVETLI